MTADDVLDLAAEKKARGEAFALATVVRTVSVTAAKAGAKAVIADDGSISGGWIGGGCARAAVVRAARSALSDGRARLVSIKPEDLLAESGTRAGEEVAGVTFAVNHCPSQGSMDIFVEPILPKPILFILGASPVAVALADLGARLGFAVTVAAHAGDRAAFGRVDRFVDGLGVDETAGRERYVVVATQGASDRAALETALRAGAASIAFVGSRRKAAALAEALLSSGAATAERISAIKSPAGLDIGAITSEEIALSIIAEIVAARRQGQREGA